MKILKFLSENVKKLTVVEITPKGDIVKITGKNGAGKTAVLDSILWACRGADTIQDQPIRQGAEKAMIELDLGDIKVTRRFTSKGSYLDVVDEHGEKFKSPQAMLTALAGPLSFDPLAFQRMSPREQAAILTELIGVDTTKLDDEHETLFDERTEVGREVKQAQAIATAAKETAPNEDPGPAESSADLAEEIRLAVDRNAKNDRARQNAVQLKSDFEDAVDAIEIAKGSYAQEVIFHDREIAAKKAALKSAQQAKEEAAKRCRKEIDSAKTFQLERGKVLAAAETAVGQLEDIDISPLYTRSAGVDAHNEAVRAWGRSIESAAGLDKAGSKHRRLDRSIDANREARRKMLDEATMPVDGLSVDAGIISLDGVPLDQASQADQLDVAVSIAMAGEPELRVIRITDASLLDSDSLARLAAKAKKRKYQVWLEMVDETGDVGIYLEDGHVAADNQEK